MKMYNKMDIYHCLFSKLEMIEDGLCNFTCIYILTVDIHNGNVDVIIRLICRLKHIIQCWPRQTSKTSRTGKQTMAFINILIIVNLAVLYHKVKLMTHIRGAKIIIGGNFHNILICLSFMILTKLHSWNLYSHNWVLYV